jgi:hypothetical protein
MKISFWYCLQEVSLNSFIVVANAMEKVLFRNRLGQIPTNQLGKEGFSGKMSLE